MHEELMRDSGGRVRAREVDRHNVGPFTASGSDLVGEGRKLGFAPRHERDLVAVFRKDAGERGADAGRRTGDQGDGLENRHPCLRPRSHARARRLILIALAGVATFGSNAASELDALA